MHMNLVASCFMLICVSLDLCVRTQIQEVGDIQFNVATKANVDCTAKPDFAPRATDGPLYHFKSSLGAGAFGDVCLGISEARVTKQVALKGVPYNVEKVTSARPEVTIAGQLGAYLPELDKTRHDAALLHIGYRHINPIEDSFTEIPGTKCLLPHDTNGYPKQMCDGLPVLTSRRHKNWVSLMGEDPLPTYWIVYPFAPHGSLDQYMHTTPSLRSNHGHLVQMIRGILLGLSYMVQKEVMWADMKLANVLVDERRQPLLHDFGLSKVLKWTHPRKGVQYNTISAATMVYAPPEYVQGYTEGNMNPPRLKYNDATVHSFDAWSMGMSLLELACKTTMEEDEKHPLLGTNLTGSADQVFDAQHRFLDLPWSERISLLANGMDAVCSAGAQKILGPAGLHLVANMLCRDPDKRITPTEALEHAFLDTTRAGPPDEAPTGEPC